MGIWKSGGTIFHYPRQNLVLTTLLELPLYGTLKESETSKKELLGVWQTIVKMFSLNIRVGTKVEAVERSGDGFVVRAGTETWVARNVILVLGRRGSPRRLGVPGEHLPMVAYRLQEAESLQRKKILVVGGGESAVEAAVALARQPGNVVTLSYRREAFVRLKEKNEKNTQALIHARRITALMGSVVQELRATEAVIELADTSRNRVPHDAVFIFAGGDAPTELPRKAGIAFRTS